MYKVEEIREYVRSNWRFFGPDGLGWKSASNAINTYAANHEAWADDLYSVDELRQKENRAANDALLAEARAARGEMTGSSGMSRETREMIAEIRRMTSEEGLSPEVISETLGVSVMGVRNVLRLGDRVGDIGAAPPEQHPAVRQFIANMKSF